MLNPEAFFPVLRRVSEILEHRDVRQLMRRTSAEQAAAVRTMGTELQLSALLDEVLGEPDQIDA